MKKKEDDLKKILTYIGVALVIGLFLGSSITGMATKGGFFSNWFGGADSGTGDEDGIIIGGQGSDYNPNEEHAVMSKVSEISSSAGVTWVPDGDSLIEVESANNLYSYTSQNIEQMSVEDMKAIIIIQSAQIKQLSNQNEELKEQIDILNNEIFDTGA
ncbi:MAG: hypothetical protein ABIJ18_00100 [archaeon]